MYNVNKPFINHFVKRTFFSHFSSLVLCCIVECCFFFFFHCKYVFLLSFQNQGNSLDPFDIRCNSFGSFGLDPAQPDIGEDRSIQGQSDSMFGLDTVNTSSGTEDRRSFQGLYNENSGQLSVHC